MSHSTPRWPALNAQLYESPFCGQLCLAFGPTRRLLYCGDAWPRDRLLLPRGRCLVRLQIRHPEAAVLEGLAELPMLLEHALCKPVALACVVRRGAALGAGGGSGGGGGGGGGNGKVGTVSLAPGAVTSFFVKEPTDKVRPSVEGCSPRSALLCSALLCSALLCSATASAASAALLCSALRCAVLCC